MILFFTAAFRFYIKLQPDLYFDGLNKKPHCENNTNKSWRIKKILIPTVYISDILLGVENINYMMRIHN